MGIEITELKSDPCPCGAGEQLTVSCRPVCTEGALKSVKISIPPFGDFPLFDDGTHGDAVAGDGIYTRQETIPFLAPRGRHRLKVTAESEQGETASAILEIEIN